MMASKTDILNGLRLIKEIETTLDVAKEIKQLREENEQLRAEAREAHQTITWIRRNLTLVEHGPFQASAITHMLDRIGRLNGEEGDEQ